MGAPAAVLQDCAVVSACCFCLVIENLLEDVHLAAVDGLRDTGLEFATPRFPHATKVRAAAATWLDARALELELQVIEAVSVEPQLLCIGQADLEGLRAVRDIDQPAHAWHAGVLRSCALGAQRKQGFTVSRDSKEIDVGGMPVTDLSRSFTAWRTVV